MQEIKTASATLLPLLALAPPPPSPLPSPPPPFPHLLHLPPPLHHLLHLPTPSFPHPYTPFLSLPSLPPPPPPTIRPHFVGNLFLIPKCARKVFRMIKWSSHFNTIVLSLQPLICHKIVFLQFYNTTGDIERVELFSTQDKAMTSLRRRRLFFSMNKWGYVSKETVEQRWWKSITG